MSVVSEVSGRASVRRPMSVELGAIAVVWVLLFAAAYSLSSSSGTRAAVSNSTLATGSPVNASAVVAGAATQAKHTTLVSLPSVPAAPAMKLAPPPPKKRQPPVVVSQPVTVTPVAQVAPPVSTPVVQPPPTSTPSSGGTQQSSSGGSHSSGSSGSGSGQSGTGTVSGGG